MSARPAPAQHKATPAAANSGRDRGAAAVAERSKQPWKNPQPNDRPALKSNPEPARIASRPPPQAGGTRKTIVTGKWWDARGPRTIELGPKGQQLLSSSFVTLFFMFVIAAVVVGFIEPLLLFAGAFVLFRFGGNFLGPMGAGIIDKALAEKG